MLGIPVVTLKTKETPSLGVAILAGVGSGVFKNIQEGCDRVVVIDEKIIPDKSKKDVYNKVYKQYSMLYKLNKPLWDK